MSSTKRIGAHEIREWAAGATRGLLLILDNTASVTYEDADAVLPPFGPEVRIMRGPYGPGFAPALAARAVEHAGPGNVAMLLVDPDGLAEEGYALAAEAMGDAFAVLVGAFPRRENLIENDGGQHG